MFMIMIICEIVLRHDWIQIIKTKITGFNYINIDKIKYKNIRFYL